MKHYLFLSVVLCLAFMGCGTAQKNALVFQPGGSRCRIYIEAIKSSIKCKDFF